MPTRRTDHVLLLGRTLAVAKLGMTDAATAARHVVAAIERKAAPDSDDDAFIITAQRITAFIVSLTKDH
jgi:hypothetical protein